MRTAGVERQMHNKITLRSHSGGSNIELETGIPWGAGAAMPVEVDGGSQTVG